MTISHNFEAGNKTSNQLAGGQAINETLEMFKHFFFIQFAYGTNRRRNSSIKSQYSRCVLIARCAQKNVVALPIKIYSG